MKHVCISHAPLRFKPSVPFEFYSPLAIEGVETTVIPDDSLGPLYDGRVLSEYLQLFVLADKWRGSDELIHLFQYRRFLTSKSPPPDSSVFDGNVFVEPEIAQLLVPRAERLASVAALTVGSIMRYAVAEQYGRFHPPEDLANFARAAAFSGALTQAEAEQFYAAKVFLVSPTIGIYPAAMLVEHLEIMRKAWDYFRDCYYVPREGYQRRVGGYLLERLQSYLVLRHIDSHRHERANIWYRIALNNAVRTFETTA